jgi:hypothetical protein
MHQLIYLKGPILRVNYVGGGSESRSGRKFRIWIRPDSDAQYRTDRWCVCIRVGTFFPFIFIIQNT